MSSPEINKITVIGGGIIGSSWSTYFLWKELSVAVYDINAQALALARERIAVNLAYLVEKKVIKNAVAKVL